MKQFDYIQPSDVFKYRKSGMWSTLSLCTDKIMTPTLSEELFSLIPYHSKLVCLREYEQHPTGSRFFYNHFYLFLLQKYQYSDARKQILDLFEYFTIANVHQQNNLPTLKLPEQKTCSDTQHPHVNLDGQLKSDFALRMGLLISFYVTYCKFSGSPFL